MIVCLQDASRRLNDTSVAADTDLRWREIFAQEQEAVTTKMPLYEKERQVELHLTCPDTEAPTVQLDG